MSAKQKLLDRYVERYNAGDLDAVMDLYAEDAVQLMPDGFFEGRSTIRERLAQELNGFSDLAHRVESFVEQGDAFADEWTFVGTHTGPFALPDGGQLPPTGSGWSSGVWSSCRCATGRSSLTTCTTTTWPSPSSSASSRKSRPRDRVAMS